MGLCRRLGKDSLKSPLILSPSLFESPKPNNLANVWDSANWTVHNNDELKATFRYRSESEINHNNVYSGLERIFKL